MSESTKLVQSRKGARRRVKVKLLAQVLLSLLFVAAAVMLSAGIVRVVERPVAPWKISAAAKKLAAPAAVVVAEGRAAVPVPAVPEPVPEPVPTVPEPMPVPKTEIAQPLELFDSPGVAREIAIDDLAEAAQDR